MLPVVPSYTSGLMPPAHEIAIIEPNTLAAVGLRIILEELIPSAVIRVFATFGQLTDDTPDMYAHYFVSSQIYFEHTAFFLGRRPKTIVLCIGYQPLPAGIPALNICRPQEKLVKDIMQLQQHGHESMHRPMNITQDTAHELSPREIEVLILVARGLINKEIADKLNISLTTVISHRKNITEKLGIKSVAALAVYAVMNGYIEADRI